MIRLSFITLFLFFCAVFAFGQNDDEKSIRQILTDITNVNKSGDFTILDKIFADDFIFITAQGKTYNKTERIAFVKSVPPPDFFEYSKVQTRIYGKTAVVNAETNLIPRGKTAETHIVTIVMVKNGNRWQEVNVQATHKPEAR